jgi:hypothetical protein
MEELGLVMAHLAGRLLPVLTQPRKSRRRTSGGRSRSQSQRREPASTAR